MASTQDIRPVILEVTAPGILRMGDAEFQCALGPAGITSHKREGDGATPAGSFPLRSVMYRPDRVSVPSSMLLTRQIKYNDGWCDDPAQPEYNRLVSLPYPASHERLWREDHIYDLIVEVGYNDDPPVPGKGSAIFMHIAREDYAPTQGCVALQKDDLLFILNSCGPDPVLRITP